MRAPHGWVRAAGFEIDRYSPSEYNDLAAADFGEEAWPIALGPQAGEVARMLGRPFLECALREATDAMPADSPNRHPERPEGGSPFVTLLRQTGTDGDVCQLLRCLCATAAAR